ncbi:hypothetical protein ACFVYP_28440 [Kitasatospora sp. NPDC058201]|uniref:hypothetical protein n=1 Tax=unclassified Kitasatospora TaxID=2633591 RepID=UPI00365F7F1D
MQRQHGLTLWDGSFINFRDFAFPDGEGHGYRWVDIKRFRLLGDPPDDRAGWRP